jgi:hypothetical protein
LAPILTYGLITLDVGLLVWQIRYGARIAKFINGFPLTWIIWSIVLMVIAATFTNALDRLASHYTRPSKEAVAPTVMTVTDGTAHYSGEIDFAAFNSLEETLRLDPNLKTLRLTSAGGRIAAARGMARLVEENTLGTEVTGICASACTLVFIAGTPRSLNPDAQLGFHGYELVSGIVTLSTADEETRDKETFASRGVDAAFLDQAFAVPHDQMWFPSFEELKSAGVISR